jgi:hypothetical protein
MNIRDQLRKNLLNSMAQIFSGATNPLLLGALKNEFPRLSFALVVYWIPEQAEDIYWLIIDLDRVAVVEIPRAADDFASVTIDILDLAVYQRQRHSTETKVKLEVAIDLMRERWAPDL